MNVDIGSVRRDVSHFLPTSEKGRHRFSEAGRKEKHFRAQANFLGVQKS